MKKNKNQIYEELRFDIMNLKLIPGKAISEIEISNIYDISRTPVREILKKLSEENLIEIYPQIGSFISKIDLKMVDDALFLRKLCEKKIILDSIGNKSKDTLLTELKRNIAFQEINYNYNGDSFEFFKLDNEFHFIMFKHNNRENIWKNICKFTTHYDRLRLIDAVEKTNQEKIIEEHKLIVDIIENSRIELVEDTVNQHLEKYKNLLEYFITKYPNYFK
ncbi:hypothetical protein FUSO6_02205 [Fusobacterium necrophorum DAB]|uniref:GntR family transcriptional regulator n=1 Tax=Fusobacterium necrophorum TaxID=859 RepID=UPI000461BF28|nr:GntR family transcriptional regulator [Fusobacterium necrophorum]KDE71085.1 hypothetical protein FUSO6_02205 [Fusobacterium necrophorum DAB]